MFKDLKTQSSGSGFATIQAGPYGDAQRKVMSNTLLLLALTMIPTVIGAVIGVNSMPFFKEHPILSFAIAFGGAIGLMFGVFANRNSHLGIVFLLAMTGVMGWALGPLLNHTLALKNGAQLIGFAGAGTGVILFATYLITTITQKDFSFMGKFLFIGVIGLILASIANIFLAIPALALTLATLGLVIFSLFLLYDLSRIVTGGEENYIVATTGVYLDVINIFSSLLQLLGVFGGERD